MPFDLGRLPLSETRTNVYGLIAESATSARTTKIDAAINRGYEKVCKILGDSLERSDDLGLRKPSSDSIKTFESGENVFPLPWGARDVQAIVPQISGADPLRQMTASQLAREYLPTTTGLPRAYAIVDQSPQWRPMPTENRTLVFFGDTANDGSTVTAHAVYQRYGDNLGEFHKETIGPGTFSAGITTQSACPAGWPLKQVFVSQDWQGEIIVKTGDGDGVVDSAQPYTPVADSQGSRIATRPLIRVGPVPDQDYACTVVWRHVPPRLRLDTDAPEIPVSTYLEYFAAAEMKRIDNDFVKANVWDSKAREILQDIDDGEEQRHEQLYPLGGNFVDQTGSWFGTRGW